jgi:glycosyltransferase involved in cell wall biosynthesis
MMEGSCADAAAPSISVIVPSYRAATLGRVLAALEPQTRHDEIIVVDSSADGSAAAACQPFPRVRLIELAQRALPGMARNIGAVEAKGALLAFVDADVILQPSCLDALRAALTPGVDLAVGAVCNGTPRSPAGTAGYLLEFLDFAPFRQSAPRHGVGCVMLVRRDAFERAGGFPEDLWPGEDTVFSLAVTDRAPLAFVPAARVMHLNRTGFGSYLRHQRALGASFSRASRVAALPGRRFGAFPLVFAAAPLRLVSLARRVSTHPRTALSALALTPWLLIGLAAWAVGAVSAARAAPEAPASRSMTARAPTRNG